MAILSLVGKQMRNLVGIAGRMFTTLAGGDVNIEMISQGASEINISCCIDGRDAVKALNLIHQSCLQIHADRGPGIGVGRNGNSESFSWSRYHCECGFLIDSTHCSRTLVILSVLHHRPLTDLPHLIKNLKWTERLSNKAFRIRYCI